MKNWEITQPELSVLLSEPLNQKIPALPLQFEHLPVQLLSKEFTKLNNPHPYRIHYLGPRYIHTLAMHKRYAYNEEFKAQEAQDGGSRAYPAPLRRIFNSNYMNERLRDNHHYRSSFFYRAFEGMNPTISQEELAFNSAFENGNLDCAIKVGPSEYDLFLRVDSNSRGHTNWFHFSVKNRSNTSSSIKFNICNLGRRPGLYDQGLKPFVKSTKAFNLRGEGWTQKGEDIELQAASMRYNLLGSKGNNFFRLSFSYQPEFEDDQIFFAYCAPYTYSDLHSDIQTWMKSKYLKKGILGRSLSGLQLPLLHITNHATKGFIGYPKKNIAITGRAHPAESSGSYVLRGFIQWLIGSSQEASDLRDRTNFFIIPMLNPDGVVLGNSRTSGAGKDLNREFLSVRRDLYPQVYLTKTFIARLQKIYKVLVFLDFHGHSMRKNTFFYGPAYPISHREYYRCRAFPKLIEKLNPTFRFYSCSFMISQAKRSAARAVALTQLKVPYAYTVQSSVGLYYDPNVMKTLNFTTEAWEDMGKNIAMGLTQFLMGLQELEVISRERKLQREKLRSGKNKQKQHEIEKKQRKKIMLLDVIEQVKVVVNKGTFDDDVQSDDHDSAEDLQPYQLSEFNNLIILGRQRQRRQQNRIVSEQQQNVELPQMEQEDVEEVNPYEQIQRCQSIPRPPTRMTRSVEAKTSSKVIRTTEHRKRSKIMQMKVDQVSRSQTSIQSNKFKDPKNFIKVNRQRYSTTNLKLLGEDRCQIISLPKTPLIKRQKTSQKQEKPVPEVMNRKSIRAVIDKLDLKIGKNIHPIETNIYHSLRGLQLDNRAMTITSFRRR